MSEYRYVLDTYAILTVIEDEPGAQTVAEIITTQGAMLYLSIISLGEIYYILLRRRGEQAAEEVVQNTLARTIIAPTEISVGTITALIGAPFFLYLLLKKRKRWWS